MEYARFGAGWVRRSSPGAAWEPCPVDDLPADVVIAALRRLPVEPALRSENAQPSANGALRAVRRA